MIHQIYYNEETEKNCMKGAKKIFNKSLHPSFENQVIATIAPTIEDSHFGIFSHKFSLKHGKKHTVDSIMKEAEKVDVLSFFNKHKQKCMIDFMSLNQQYNFRALMETLLKGTDMEVKNKTKFIVYGNTFVAKKEIYHDYVNKVLKPAFVNSRQVIDELMKPSNYKGAGIGTLNTKYRMKMTTYPIWPFAFELLFSIYLDNHDYDCKHI